METGEDTTDIKTNGKYRKKRNIIFAPEVISSKSQSLMLAWCVSKCKTTDQRRTPNLPASTSPDTQWY